MSIHYDKICTLNYCQILYIHIVHYAQLLLPWVCDKIIAERGDTMNKQYDQITKWKSKNVKRIPLEVRLDDYELIKAAAEHSNMSVNGWIKLAIAERLEQNQVINIDLLRAQNEEPED